MPIDIFSLLPHSPNTQLNDEESKFRILYLVKFFIEEIIQSITLFYINRKYSSFDAHVGETLCQIRACLLLELIYNSKLNHDDINELLGKYNNLNNQCLDLLNNLNELKITKNGKFNKTLDANIKLINFLQINNLNFQIEHETLFLVQSYFLAKFSLKDNMGVSQAMNYEFLYGQFSFAKTLSRKIVRFFQKKLSEISTEFILTQSLKLEQLQDLRFILPKLKKIDNHNRTVLPCYETTQVLLEFLIQKQHLVLLICTRYFNSYTDTIPILFLPVNENYIFSSDMKKYSNVPTFIIKGVAIYEENQAETKENYCKRIIEVGLKNILLANMSAHPQFSAIEFEKISHNPYPKFFSQTEILMNDCTSANGVDVMSTYKAQIELVSKLEKNLLLHKVYAAEHGCCQYNQTLFFVKHIFCDLICNQYNELVRLSNYDDQNVNKRNLQATDKIEELA